MRIVSGSLGGRQFEAPKGHRTHPMSEKARGGLFSALGDVEGLTLLDAFAGSGAISFEAVSRGVKHSTAIDIDKGAIDTVVHSSRKLKIEDKIKAVRANASGWSDNNPDALFDIVICDPPFDRFKVQLIQKLTRHLKSEGIFIVSQDSSLKPSELKTLKIVKTRPYGDAQLIFYKKVI